jgi:subtilisin family serine protease
MSVWIEPAQAAEAMKRGDGRGVLRIAVLDSGVEVAHPDFAGQRLHDDLVADASGGIQKGDGEDMYGHGPAVSGIIWRLAPKAEIGSFRVLGSSLSARTAQVSIAARKSIALGYKILNCSFGCGISGHLPIYKEWVDSALLSGVHVVAASGSPETSEWPAYLASVLGVDCALSNDGGLRYLRRMVEFTAPAAEVRPGRMAAIG